MRSLRTLLVFLRPYRRLVATSLASLLALVLLDLAIPRLVQRIIDRGIRDGSPAVVLQTSLVMLLVSALSAVISVGNNASSVRVGEGVARDLRAALFAHVQRWSHGNLDRQRTGHLLVLLTSDVNALKALAQVSLRIGTRAPLLMVGSLALMVATSPRLALTLLPLLAVTAALVALFTVKMEPAFRALQQRVDALNAVLQENVAGVRVVKSLVRAEHEAARFDAASEALTERSTRTLQVVSAMMPALSLCVNVGTVVVLWAGGLGAIAGELTLGEVVAFTNYLLTTLTPLVMMTMLSSTWAAGLASARRLEEIFATAPDVVDAPDARPLEAGVRPRVELQGVAFAYHGEGREPVLEGVELAAEPGQTIAVLGATGAGKTTLVNLLPRFYDPTRGRVTLGGADLRALAHDSVLARVAVVPQESILFSGTVLDNIRYGRPDATEEEVEAAARAAQAHDFVSALSDGYRTRVAQRGVNLSGGQRQRIAIARALLVRPDVLILDDATSSVDVETETRIQDALERTRGERTTFVVAQRISTVLRADEIVILERGRVVARGTHRALLASSPVYREIYESQLGGGLEGAPEVAT